MTPLNPCPFCLTDGEDRLIELWETFDAGHIAHIHCTRCGADGPSVYGEIGAAPTIARARSMWNGRAEYLKAPNTGMVPVKGCALLAAQAEIERLRATLAAIDKHSVRTLQTNSKDRGDWAEDVGFIGKLAREH